MKQELSLIDDIIHLRPKQEILFNISNFIGILIFSYYGFFHLHENNSSAATVSFSYAGLGALVLLWVNMGGSLKLAQNLILALLIPLFCLSTVAGNPRSEILAWIIVYPLLAFFYKGKRSGMIWLTLLIVALMITLFFTLWLFRSPFSPAAFFLLIACLLTVAMYVYAYDTIRSDAEQTLKNHTVALDNANRQLVEEIGERKLAQKKVSERTEELSKLNQELNETVNKLARLNAEKNELMNMVAHDLRNPLTGVLMAAKQLEQQTDLETDDNRKRIAEVKHSIQYTMRLINSFLGLKAMEAGRTTLDMRVQNVSPIISHLVAGYAARAAEKRIELVCRLQTVSALCDESALTEVAENLISNALKFSHPATRIDVSLDEKNGKAVLQVQDQGPGLSDDDKQNMFKMFTRLSPRPTAGEDSIGLGLSTAKKLVELMGGRIECNSTLGQGSTFIVTLPLTENDKE